jgi:hypothetical protein
VAAADVFDVTRTGKAPGFKCRGSDGVLHSLDITAANVAQATRLQVRLPAQATPEFAVAQAERSDFHARLDQLSPRAPVVPVLVAINLLVFGMTLMIAFDILLLSTLKQRQVARRRVNDAS